MKKLSNRQLKKMAVITINEVFEEKKQEVLESTSSLLQSNFFPEHWRKDKGKQFVEYVKKEINKPQPRE